MASGRITAGISLHMNIKKYTVLIVKRGSQYLVGRIPYSTEFRWSRSPWDAWRTRDRDAAQRVAGRVGGVPVLFNPVAAQLREVRA